MDVALLLFAIVSAAFLLFGGAAQSGHHPGEKLDKTPVRMDKAMADQKKTVKENKKKRRSRRKNRAKRSKASSSDNSYDGGELANNGWKGPQKLSVMSRKVNDDGTVYVGSKEYSKESVEATEKVTKTIDEETRPAMPSISASSVTASTLDSDPELFSPPNDASPNNSNKIGTDDETIFENVAAPNPAHPRMKKNQKLNQQKEELNDDKTEFENVNGRNRPVLAKMKRRKRPEDK
ncbi:hypothetical protein QR680_018315 [Steinernema hermaphroditum]|uniref:Uncharacterized protein n=1 Tax=Steinernema hermaphroditum TaxID=289476 RepID=A0AA39HHK5_9BILA|nr:hypothetical protein QR680_018315 [Steinernema hermaphroditum]